MEKKILEDIRDFLLEELSDWHNESVPRIKFKTTNVAIANDTAYKLAMLISYADDLGIDIRNEETEKYIKEN